MEKEKKIMEGDTGFVNTNFAHKDSFAPYVEKQGETPSKPSALVGEINDVLDGVQENTLYFRDGKRCIDMIMAYVDEDADSVGLQEREAKRKIYQENLLAEGLELEHETKDKSQDKKTNFIKIHIPWETLRRYAEVDNLKLPMMEREDDDKYDYWGETSCNRLKKVFDYNSENIGKPVTYYMATYSRDREDQFLNIDRDKILSTTQRSEIVWQILTRTRFDSSKKVGIRRLLNDKVYIAAYPLHEGRYDRDNPTNKNLDRRLLYLEWARPSKWYKRQPLWLIKKYFGEQIGLYFAWLGFYTTMLIPAAFVGLLVFIYGLATMGTSMNTPSHEICDKSGAGNITLCPMCDDACEYLVLSDSCFFSKLTYLFDNAATVFFAVFMSFWATTFLEMWKRRQTVLTWQWDLYDIEEDSEARLEHETHEKKFRINPVTKESEAYVPTYAKVARYTTTGAMVLFMVAVVVASLLGTIIYRISVLAVIYQSKDAILSQNAKLISSATAALINLVVILILTVLYKMLAIWMVNLENPRTQTEFENSYTFKIFIFQFVNFYSALIYIAFFKGRFFIYPGDEAARVTGVLQLRSDICDPAGCLPELFIQLAIVMVGKQILNNFLEYFMPLVLNWWRKRAQKNRVDESKLTRWEEDFNLQEVGLLALFEEYLEMVLQYGFVTLFVAAFPLAPLFALLNNIGEIRLDAYKMLTQTRRCVGKRVGNIGAWYGILKTITYIAVVFNGFVIAFTSDFIPRMVYMIVYSANYDLKGYIDFSLSEFNTSDYQSGMGTSNDVEICQYRGYRIGPDSPDKYQPSILYWHVFGARLAFVVVFEHVVFALTGLVASLIPDIPNKVKLHIQREKHLSKEAKYEHAGCVYDCETP